MTQSAPGCITDSRIHETYVANGWYCGFKECPKNKECQEAYSKKNTTKDKCLYRQLEFNFSANLMEEN